MNQSRIRWADRRGLPRTHHDLTHMSPRARDQFFATKLLSTDAAYWAARDVAERKARSSVVVFVAHVGDA